MSLSTVVSLLPGLSPAELEQVRSRVGALLSVSGSITKRGDDDSDEKFVLRCVYDHNRMHGRDLTPVSMLQKDAAIPKFRKYLPDLMLYLETGAGKQLTQKQGLLMVSLELLSQNIEEMKLPCTSRMLLRQMPRIPAVVNRAFPGYWIQGMLPFVIKAYTKESKHG